MYSKRLKIIQIIPELNLRIMGGIGRFLQTLLVSIDKEKTENIVLTYKSDPEDRVYYESLGIPVFSLLENTNLPDKTAIETTKWLIKTLKTVQPDIVTTHGFWGSTLGVESAYKARIPVIITIDDNIDLDEIPQQKRIKKHLANKNDCIVCVSHSVKNYAHQVEGIPEAKLRVIHNGIRLEEYPFQFKSPALDNNLNQEDRDDFKPVGNFVFIARLEPQKVPSRVIDAIATLQKKGHDCQLSIIGDGILKTECEQQVKQLQLTDKIKFLGYQEKPWQSIDNDSIFVMSSDFEGNPLAVFEAMASGYLCILPDIEPVLEIVTQKEEALIYQAKNQVDLENKMELVLTVSSSKKALMINESRNRVEEKFDAKVMSENYLNLYQELFWQKLGDKLVQKSAFNKAISAYRKVLKFNRDSACSYQNLAEIFAQKGWRKEAVNFYAQAWLSNPKQVKTWHENYQSITHSQSQDRLIKKSVFVVGCLHSGTTLMLRLLGNHPSFHAINSESEIFTKSYSKIEEQLEQWDETYKQNNQQIWVEKTPEHIYTLGKIFAHRPHSKIIWILRDGRDVLCSQLKIYEKKFGFEKLLNHWIASNIAGLNFLDDSRIKLVKYEDIVTQTEQTLTDIFHFLKEDYVQDILDYQEKPFYFMNNKKITKAKNINEKGYITQLRNWQVNQPIFDGRGRWKTEMTEEQKTIFKEKAQKYLIEFNYVSDDKW